jgi:hypothetical protein
MLKLKHGRKMSTTGSAADGGDESGAGKSKDALV